MMPKLECGYLVYLLSKEVQIKVKQKLEKQLTKSSNYNIKISKDHIFAAVNECFLINNCPHQNYIDGKFYCTNQEQLKKYK